VTFSNSIVRLKDVPITVGRGGGRRLLIDRFSIDLKKGERVAIAGPNGSGKSTILKTILGQLPMTKSHTTVMPKLNDLSYAPQHYRNALFPWLSVEQNVSLYRSGPTHSSGSKFRSVLSALSIEFCPKSIVGRLSGGEQQLLLLALILAQQRRVILLDEPFSAVDINRRPRARAVIDETLIEIGACLVLVSHDIRDIAELTDEALILSSDDHAGAKTIRAAGRSPSDKSAYYVSLQELLDAPRI